MPPIFHRQAYEAAAGRAPDVASFETWEQLATALDELTPEQRCDAVYADWLLQLHSPAHHALLQIRNLLIDQGALAANYLAELAQNADDAAGGKDAEVRIVLDGDWLFVANNGRKITSKNLLGLSRFFVHAAEMVHELNAETIGRFGIGFKSSYHIASEVFVHTREGDDAFSFRLPICRVSDPASHPNSDRLNHLRSRLTAVGVGGLENAFLDVNSLGYCTPEFVLVLPSPLSECTAALRQSEQGTLFCFHLRSEARAEVQRRISGQAHEVYELCPLFLPKLSLVQLGPNTLRIVANRTPTADLPGTVEADKVILTTRAPNQPQSHSRFWRLRGVAPGDLWQLALHADGQHRLRLDLEDDEQGVTLKEGSAYAFFPLNGMNQTWPFRLHLHCKLPTKLERDNWNPADAADVEDQLRRAVRGMVAWLETRMDMLAHGEWGFERLVNQRPAPPMNEGDWPAKWANVIFGELLKAVEERPLLRSVFGRRVLKAEAQRIEVVENQAARDAWSQLASASDLGGELPAFVPAGTAVFGVAAARPDEIGGPFGAILSSQIVCAANRQAAMLAYLSTSSHSTKSLERTFEGALVERADGNPAKLGDLMVEPCGTELSPEWHSCFARLTEWGRDAVWQSAHVFNGRLPDQFRKLSTPVFNPTWAELPVRLGSLEAWQTHGKQFWRNPRRPCPPDFLASALACLHVPSGDGGWLPLSNLWLDDDAADCFAGLLTAWPLSYINAERQRTTSLLKDWGLFSEWERMTQATLKEKLPGELTRRLTDKMAGDAFAAVFNQAFQDARRPLDGSWTHIINESEKAAVSRFVRARATEQDLFGKTVLSASIAAKVRAALCLDAEFVLAPLWLTDATHARICHLGLQENLGFQFLSQQDYLQQRGTFARELLDQFHLWMDAAPTCEALAGLNEMAATESCANRRNWAVRFSDENAPLLRELIHAQSEVADANPAAHLNRLLLETVDDWRTAERLPTLLAQVPSLTEACVQAHTLILELPNVTRTPIAREQIPAGFLEVGPVRALVEAGDHGFFTSTQALKLRWRQGGHVVATLPAADYFVDGNQLVFAHSLPPADEEQFREVLALYQRYDVTSAAYRRDQEAGLAGFSLYQNHRDQITKVLIEKEVRAVGYGEQHVLRELLQNAESAYASKASTPAEPWFHFIVTAPAQGGLCKVIACHMGRAFNEPDKAGNERLDVDRIVKVNAPNQNTEDEVGRFNKGFKCVFSVAHEQRVSIHSGGFSFTVQDLLLRVPNPPKKDPNDQNPETKFTFDAKVNDVRVMLGLDETQNANTPLRVFNASSFVFLRHLRRVKVVFAGREWTWSITRQSEGNGWGKVTVNAGAGQPAEDFLVFHGRQDGTTGRCYAVAVRLKDGLPTKLEPVWRSLRLTFETDEPLNVDVLVNGQFDAALGRRNLVDVAGSGLVDAAFQAAVELCESELTRENSKARWLAWARVLHLRDGLTGLEGRASSFEILSQRMKQFLTTRIPHAGAAKSVEQFVFPTGLMRKLLQANYASRWGVPFTHWIDAEVEEELPNAERTEFSLPKWLGQQTALAPKLHEIQSDLGTNQFRTLTERFTQPQKEEFAEAQRILTEKLRPTAPVIARSLPIADWTATQLWSWWKNESEPAQLYTLDGDSNWPLLFPNDSTPKARRSEKLRTTLAQPEGEGREAWYRLLSLACLLSAQGRTETLRNFWLEKLEAGGFWNATGLKCDFANVTRELFGNLVLQRHRDGAATGEWADYWRRVFYDVRKVHELVWHHNFAETIVQLALDSSRAGDLTLFLRGGQLAGQPAWAGVLGQSSGAPLFFVARELCRLNLANSTDLKRLAFFPCTPVRRAALSIGWLQPPLARATDFNSLAKVSEQLHQRVKGHPELANLFDIPLLHMGLTCDSPPPAHAAD